MAKISPPHLELNQRQLPQRISISVIAIVLAVLATQFSEILFSLKYCISFFSVSRSDFKVYYYLCGIALLCALPSRSERVPLNAAIVVSLSIILYAIGLWQFLWLLYKYNGGIFDWVALYWERALTSTQLMHTHNAKGAIAQFLSDWIGYISLTGYENGIASLAFHSKNIFRLQYMLWAVLLFSAFRYGRYRENESLSHFLIRGIALLSTLKGVADGGILWTENFIAFALICIFFYCEKKKSSESFIFYSTLIVLTSCTLVYGMISLLIKPYWWTWKASIEPLYAYLFLGFASAQSLLDIRPRYFLLGLALFLLPQVYFIKHKQWVHEVTYFSKTIEEGTVLRYYLPALVEPPDLHHLFVIQSEEYFYGMRKFDLKAKNDFRASEMHNSGFNLNTRNFTRVGLDCPIEEKILQTRRVWVDPKVRSLWEQRMLSLGSNNFIEVQKDPLHSDVFHFFIEPCSPNPMELVLELFHSVGKEAVIIFERPEDRSW